MVLRLDEEISLAKLLARAAECTGNPTRRLFSEDGQEILSVNDVQKTYEKILQEGGEKKAKPSSDNPALSIDLELVSTDGSNFKWKWGSNHAHYQFGDLLIRPLWRSLAGSRGVRAVVHPPQPLALPSSGNLHNCLPDLWIQCFPLCERYGPLVKLRIFDDVVYIVADPEIVDIVNQIPDKRLPREVFGCPALAGQGVFIADGQRWEFARHAFQAQLTPEAIDNLVPIFAQRAAKLQDVLAQSTSNIDIFNWVERVTMDTICDVGFGHDLKCMDSAEMPPLLPLFEEVLEVSINSSLYGAFDIMGSQARWFKSQLDKLNGMLDEIITACREGRSTGSSNSLLHALIAAKCPLTGRSFTQSELQDQLLTMLVAGHKTTTLLLTWSLYYIGRSPQVEKKLFSELRQVFGGDMERAPTGEDLRRLKYMDMVVRETLRLCAPVQVAQRGLTQPVECGKYTLLPGGHSGRGNSWVAIHIMGISLSKKYWGSDAMEFIPERFEPEKLAKFHPFQFMPFGGGRRLCIGNLFAIIQAKTLLSITLRKFYVRIAPDKPVKIDPKDLATPLPASRGGGVWLNFTSRDYDEPAAPEPGTAPGALYESFLNDATAQSFAGTSFKRSLKPTGGSFFTGPRPSLLVLWGGEFGTTLGAAQDFASAAEQRDFPVQLKALDEVKPSALLAGEVKSDSGELPVVLIVVATYNGHPPPNAASFLKELAEVPAAEEGSNELTFAVLGVGNSNWVSTFVKAAKDVERLLIRAGANRLLPLEAADKNDCFERQLRTWRKVIFTHFASSPAELVKEAEGETHAEEMAEQIQLEPFTGSPTTSLQANFVERLGYQNCTVSLNEELCVQSDASSPSVRQIVIDRPGGCAYACGDHLEVRPRNLEAQVLRCCHRLGVQPDAVVVVQGDKVDDELPSGQPITVGDVLSFYVDLSALPSQEALASLVPHVTSASEAAKLKLLTVMKEDSEYERWCKRCLSILDILEEFGSIQVSVGRFVEVAPKMQARLYSIASSPLARGSNVELCCRVATYTASPVNGREVTRKGVCSSMLAAAKSVICKIKEAPHMRLPEDPSKPIACICGGTGVAPFLGFLQERAACKKKGMQTGLVHLYFGCRNDTDFLHKSQLQEWQREGLCLLKVSLSRPTDGSAKEYVYHALRRDSADILNLLGDGDGAGYFYICGSASTLAKDVTNVLVDMLSQSGDASQGFTMLTELQEKGRYGLRPDATVLVQAAWKFPQVPRYGVTDIWWLRVWAISGCGMVVLFQLLQPQCQWLSAGWCFVYVMVNIFQMMGEGEKPDPPLTDDERKLYEQLESRISAREFADLAYYGKWMVFRAGDLLCERGCEATQHDSAGHKEKSEKCLYIIAEGCCEVSAAGRLITLLKPGNVVGEVGFLLDTLQPMSTRSSDGCVLPMQVSVREDVRCLALPVAEVQTLLKRRPDLHKPIIKLLSSTLLAKEGCVLGQALEDRRYKAVLEVACPMADQPGVAEGVAAYRRRNSISSDDHKRLLADVPRCPPDAFVEHAKPGKEGRALYRVPSHWFQRGEKRGLKMP
ncbi:CYP102A5 [Symbiodinium natans]|uniref:NADPH--hemoprotein reductase n=1 Tax=Symbiodinium natans TaxID=878477 RepID=A0A812U5S7_9DINO|nr:CYP102A5 [Symbiodinium natans]